MSAWCDAKALNANPRFNKIMRISLVLFIFLIDIRKDVIIKGFTVLGWVTFIIIRRQYRHMTFFCNFHFFYRRRLCHRNRLFQYVTLLEALSMLLMLFLCHLCCFTCTSHRFDPQTRFMQVDKNRSYFVCVGSSYVSTTRFFRANSHFPSFRFSPVPALHAFWYMLLIFRRSFSHDDIPTAQSFRKFMISRLKMVNFSPCKGLDI